jgi:hypothetical protein
MQMSVLRFLPAYSPADIVHHGVVGTIDSRYVFEMPAGEDKDTDHASRTIPGIMMQKWESVPGVLPVGDRGGAVEVEFRLGRARRHTDVVPPRPPLPPPFQRWSGGRLEEVGAALGREESCHLVPLVPKTPSQNASTQTFAWQRTVETQTEGIALAPVALGGGVVGSGLAGPIVVVPDPPVVVGGAQGASVGVPAAAPSGVFGGGVEGAQVRRSSRSRPAGDPYWLSGQASRRRVGGANTEDTAGG